MRSTPPAGFRRLCSGLHQDVFLEVKGFEGLPAYALQFVQAEDSTQLKRFLEQVLAGSSSAELKGLINREHASVRFTANEAEAFLRGVLALL